MYFSKALFKQSMKANWVKWVCVTVATCVMLAIVIIVLGSLAINDIRDSLKDVFTQADQQSILKENSVDSYDAYNMSVTFAHNINDDETLGMIGSMFGSLTGNYTMAITNFETENGRAPTDDEKNTIKDEVSASLASQFAPFAPAMGFDMTEDELAQFLYVLFMVYDDNPTFALPNANDYIDDTYTDGAQNPAYLTALDSALNELKESLKTNLIDYSGDVAYDRYIALGETEAVANGYAMQAEALTTYAISSYESQMGNDGFEYSESAFKAEANNYVINLIYNSTKLQLGGTDMTEDEIEMQAVAAKVLANTAISTYELWLEEYSNEDKYPDMTDASIKASARDEAIESITDQIPEKVAEALEELGNMDIYGLIIGSIFYRIAGLLLPMVFVIMVANGLLAGQVDSGSMAYVLSTPTKRRTVACTQMAYLMISLLAMFLLVTVTSVISIWIVGGNNFAINFAEICLFNLGAFLTMFAFAGYCFMCSAIFNRSKYSMSIGGGLSIFMLVCTILGLFGSNVVPSAMRIDAMNVFNYFSIISLFDTVSILNGTIDFAWKFAILAGISIVTFIIGVFRFEKKDLPL